MLYRPFGATGEKVSVLGFGAMRLPVIEQRHDCVDLPAATEMIRYAVDCGVNYIDTAYSYHGSSAVGRGTGESVVGRVLQGGYREKVLLATKLIGWSVESRADMDRVLSEQLDALCTDHVDCYLLHGIGASGWARFRDLGVIDFLDAAKADGRIRYAGFSFHDNASTFTPIVDAYDWDFCQIQYNYMDVDYQAGRDGLRYAARRGLGVVVMGPVKGGRLAGHVPEEVQAVWDAAPVKRTPAEWALRFVWDDPDVSVVLSGMSTMEQVMENVRIAGSAVVGSLSRAELDAVAKVRRIYEERVAVPCTECRYCMPCPAGIDIPRVFSLLNDASLYGNPWEERFLYRVTVDVGGTARLSGCTACGQCREACPQHIDVPGIMADCVRLFESAAEGC
jgi:predicted aldo/keto reductase-like oxidoreductase